MVAALGSKSLHYAHAGVIRGILLPPSSPHTVMHCFRMRVSWGPLIATLLWALAVAAAPAGPACAEPSAATPQKVLRYAIPTPETGLDGVRVSDLYSRQIIRQIIDAPYHFSYLGKSGQIEPSIAADMPTVSPDFRVFTFHIKRGIYFTDDPAFHGKKREVTAADVVYGMKRVFDPETKSPHYSSMEEYKIKGLAEVRAEALKTGHFDYDKVTEGLRALDRDTVRIELEDPSPHFMDNLTDPSVAGVVAREVVEEYGDNIVEHPVGTGPFMLAEWRRSSFIALKRNPDFREEYYPDNPDPDDPEAVALARQFHGRRLPMVDRVEISVVPESQARWLAFLDAEQDMLYQMLLDVAQLAYPNNHLAPNLKKAGIKISRKPQIDVSILVFNMEDPVVGGYTPEKVALRRALCLGMRTSDLIRALYQGQAIPAQGPIDPGMIGYDPTLHTEQGDYDPARARAILDSYGYVAHNGSPWRDNPDGTPLVLRVSSEPEQYFRIGDEVLKKSFDDLGIHTEFTYATWPEQLRATQAGKFMMWQVGESASSPDGQGGLAFGYGPDVGGENLARFKLPEYDQLYDKARTLPDGPERFALFRQMEKILVAYAPYKFVAHRYALDLMQPWVLGYRRQPFLYDWWQYIDIDTAQEARLRH